MFIMFRQHTTMLYTLHDQYNNNNYVRCATCTSTSSLSLPAFFEHMTFKSMRYTCINAINKNKALTWDMQKMTYILTSIYYCIGSHNIINT